MNNPETNKNSLIGIGLIFFAITVVNIVLVYMGRQEPTPEKTIPPVPIPAVIESPQPTQDVALIRKTRLDPSRTFSWNTFYQNGREVAQYKNTYEKIFDQLGDIPNGKVKFSNEGRDTYGQEEYLYGKRHGAFQEYYANGQLKREAFYSFGQLTTSKEYFIDGILRMEEDYTDALQLPDVREVGVGKVYDRRGKIKYEWHLTQNSPEYFNKSYNADGECIQTNYFDANGKLLRTEKKAPPVPTDETTPLP